jgi:hypothetical protein
MRRAHWEFDVQANLAVIFARTSTALARRLVQACDSRSHSVRPVNSDGALPSVMMAPSQISTRIKARDAQADIPEPSMLVVASPTR